MAGTASDTRSDLTTRSRIIGYTMLAGRGIFAVLIVWFLYQAFAPAGVTTQSVSPDGKVRIEVVERSHRFHIDRNFRVQLTSTNGGEPRVIFESQDQRVTISQEEFRWSVDGRYVALVGDAYWVIDDSELPDGNTLFLLYDRQTETLYCNSD